MTETFGAAERQLRVGIVGCGTQGRQLALAVARTPSLRTVACADPDDSAARRVRGITVADSISSHPSLEDLLDRATVDAVLIATPHDELAGACLTAVRAGKHVMVEKPMAMTDAEAGEVQSAAASAGVNCMVGYSFRFSVGHHVHRLIADGCVGEVHSVTAYIGHPPMSPPWTCSRERGGGPLLYVGCHMLDFLFWFTQLEPHSVFADIRRRADTGTDELSDLQIRLTGGTLAHVMVAGTAPAFAYETHVHGSAGDIALRGRTRSQCEIDVVSDKVPHFREPTTIRPVLRGDDIDAMLVPELEEFMQSISEHRAPAITVADGRKVLKVLDAAVESAQHGRPVTISQT